jgi:hypothetical protein
VKILASGKIREIRDFHEVAAKLTRAASIGSFAVPPAKAVSQQILTFSKEVCSNNSLPLTIAIFSPLLTNRQYDYDTNSIRGCKLHFVIRRGHARQKGG